MRWARFALLLIPVVLGQIDAISFSNAGALLLIVVTSVIAFFIRNEIVALVRRLDGAEFMRSAWELQERLPRVFRRIASFAIPIVLSYVVIQIVEFGGFQGVLLGVAISTPFAYFFAREPAR